MKQDINKTDKPTTQSKSHVSDDKPTTSEGNVPGNNSTTQSKGHVSNKPTTKPKGHALDNKPTTKGHASDDRLTTSKGHASDDKPTTQSKAHAPDNKPTSKGHALDDKPTTQPKAHASDGKLITSKGHALDDKPTPQPKAHASDDKLTTSKARVSFNKPTTQPKAHPSDDKPTTSKSHASDDKPTTHPKAHASDDKPTTQSKAHAPDDKPTTSKGHASDDKPTTQPKVHASDDKLTTSKGHASDDKPTTQPKVHASDDKLTTSKAHASDDKLTTQPKDYALEGSNQKKQLATLTKKQRKVLKCKRRQAGNKEKQSSSVTSRPVNPQPHQSAGPDGRKNETSAECFKGHTAVTPGKRREGLQSQSEHSEDISDRKDLGLQNQQVESPLSDISTAIDTSLVESPTQTLDVYKALESSATQGNSSTSTICCKHQTGDKNKRKDEDLLQPKMKWSGQEGKYGICKRPVKRYVDLRRSSVRHSHKPHVRKKGGISLKSSVDKVPVTTSLMGHQPVAGLLGGKHTEATGKSSLEAVKKVGQPMAVSLDGKHPGIAKDSPESPREDYQPYADGLPCYESEDVESEDVESEDVQPRKMCKFLGLVFLEVTQHTTLYSVVGSMSNIRYL